ncbi:MAG TPA: hypothetical protein VGM10_03760 [Actinocrinis sp.]
MADSNLLNRAARCYLRAGERAEAARCFTAAGAHHPAAEQYVQLGLHREAADAYAAAGTYDFAIWQLAHHVGDVAAARALERFGRSRAGGAERLRWRLALARCDVVDHRPESGPLGVLADACAYLDRPVGYADGHVESWAVAVAESMGREDQVASIYAACVRGRIPGAADRWAAWSWKVLQCELILPAAEPSSADSPTR